MDWRWGSIIPVWVLAVIAALLIGLTPAHEQFWSWIPLAFGLSVVVTFIIQIGTRTPEGYVHRAIASILGSLAVFVIATVVLVLV